MQKRVSAADSVLFRVYFNSRVLNEKMPCTVWPLIPVGKSWWTIASCKLNLGVHPSIALCLSVTVELNNYGDKPLWNWWGFKLLTSSSRGDRKLFSKLVFLPRTSYLACCREKLKKACEVCFQENSVFLDLWSLCHSPACTQEGSHEGSSFFFFFESPQNPAVLWMLEALREKGWLCSWLVSGPSYLLPTPLWCKPSPGNTSTDLGQPLGHQDGGVRSAPCFLGSTQESGSVPTGGRNSK